MTRGCGTQGCKKRRDRKLQDNFVKAARQFCDKRLLRGKFVTIGYRARNCGDNFATGLWDRKQRGQFCDKRLWGKGRRCSLFSDSEVKDATVDNRT